ncbi:unnamed protein product [Rhizoctonia solani]|uniref:Uncharacterized protein n=1 Tax=Rhizoctonia solani TaxID=456999 RepID=A0A8H3B906_9AGAM|nr:unnamed protein product [Rhizoctonia solani]
MASNKQAADTSTPDDTTNPHRRPMRGTGNLVARGLSELVSVPGLKDVASFAKEGVKALRSDIFQGPGLNDVQTQKQLDIIERLLARTDKADAALITRHNHRPPESDPIAREGLDGIKSFRRRLEVYKAELEKSLKEDRSTKFAYQNDIAQFLVQKNEQVSECVSDFCVDGSIQANHAIQQLSESNQQIQMLSEVVAGLKEQIQTLQCLWAYTTDPVSLPGFSKRQSTTMYSSFVTSISVQWVHGMPPDMLVNFPGLRSACLSMSCDYQFNPFPDQLSIEMYPGAAAELELQPGFRFLQPVTMFPPGMTSLSVQSTHGGETPLLRNLGLQCPELRALRLNKCTMFDCCTRTELAKSREAGSLTKSGYYDQIADVSECPFWVMFPFDHDIYFGGEGVEAYANEIAAELAPLRKLEEIALGVYLSPFTALAEHRLTHYPWRHLEMAQAAGNTTVPVDLSNVPPGPAHAVMQHPINIPPSNQNALLPFPSFKMPPPTYFNPALWSYDCKACRKAYSDSTFAAERAVGMVLAETLPKLKQIEWASFFETHQPSHRDCGQGAFNYRRGTGAHKWRVVRDKEGILVDLMQVH